MFKALKTLAGKFFGPGRVKMVERPRTAGYKPIDQHYFAQPRELPLFTWWTAKMMLFDPTIRLGLRMRAAPLSATEWAYKEGDKWIPGIQAENEEIGTYVKRQLDTIWEHLDALTTSQIYGWAAAEVTYKLSRRGNRVEVSELLPRQSTDTRALIRAGKPCGVRFLRVEHEAGAIVDLPFPRSIFHAHQPEAGHVYGTPILMGAYSPWADKWLNGGALDVRRLFMHKDAYGGVDVAYPDGVMTTADGTVPNRDIARQIAEQLKSGGVTYFPSDPDPNTGKNRWSVTRATTSANPAHILQYPKDLDTEMLRGMEIPDDVLESTDGAGGAWAGKQVPQLAFYNGLESWRGGLIRDVQPILDALVELNFGPGRWFQVKAKPLAEQAKEQQGAGKPQQGGGSSVFPPMGDSDGGFFGRMNGGGSNGNGQPQKMALDPERAVGEGVLSAADLVTAAGRVIRMRTGGDHVPAGARWVTIGGRKGQDGERKGGFPVLIDDNGRILRSGGPRGLVGKPVSKAGEHFDELKREKGEQQRAKIRESDAADPVGKSRSFARIVEHQAKKWGIDADTYEGIAQEVWQDKLAIHEDREAAKSRARVNLGLSAGDIKRLEEQGLDYGSVHKRIKGFDTMGRTLADSFPSLGWGSGYGADAGRNYDELLWELIKEGKQDAPSRISKEFHEEVDAFLQSEIDRHKRRKKEEPQESEWDAVQFGLRMGQATLWDEDKHPRNEDGEFIEKGRGSFETLAGKQEALFGKSGSPGQSNLFADRGVPDSMVQRRTTEITVAGKRIPVSHAADGSTQTKIEGDVKVVTYTRDGIKYGYLEDADGGNVRPFVIRKTGGVERQELPRPDESEAIEAERQRINKIDEEHAAKRAVFQAKTGHSILSAAKLASDISKAGLPIFKSTPREKQSGVTVKEVAGKKTWLLVEWRNAGTDDFDHQAKSEEIQKHIEEQGYTVTRPPDGDQTMLVVRKPLENRVKPSSIDTPAQGALAQARASKAAAWKKVQAIRQDIKDKPLSRGSRTIELMRAEEAHREARRAERQALEAIESRAQEIGKTTK